MLTLLVLGALAFAFFGVVVLPFMLIGLLFKLIFLPIRLVFFLLGGLFRLVFGLLGGLLGLVLAPVMMLVVGVAIIGALIVGVLSLLAPLLPVVLLGTLAWAIYRLVRRPNPAF